MSRPFDELDEHRVRAQRLEIAVAGQGFRLGVPEIDRFVQVIQSRCAITAQCGDAGYGELSVDNISVETDPQAARKRSTSATRSASDRASQAAGSRGWSGW